MRFLSKGRFLKTLHIWFEENDETVLKQIHGVDTIIIHGNPYKWRELDKTISNDYFPSLVNSLQDIASFKEGLSKNTLYEIRRAKKEKVETFFYNSNEILSTPELIEDFGLFYSKMYEEKGLQLHQLPYNQLVACANENGLIISLAKIDGETVVYHSYIVDDNNARLWHSCSLFRNLDNKQKNAIGRANKYLHYSDVEFFLKKGIHKYDWGGISSFLEPNGIDKFKLSFGGEPTDYYNITIRHSLKARLALKTVTLR